MLHLLSQNLKTTYSINFPIKSTCFPTDVCRKVCYGKKGRLRMPNSLLKQEQVFQIFRITDPDKVANVLIKGCKKRGLSFLRWCGNGDLFPEAVNILNLTAQLSPNTNHWITTRNVNVVNYISDLPNIYIGFSLDGSSLDRKRIVDKINHPRLYYSYLRQYKDEEIEGARIIFNLQQNRRNLSFLDQRCCPVDANKLNIINACSKCKKCFSPKIITK